MNYRISREFNLEFEEAVAEVKENLQKEGFGILTEIDVRETLKKKLNVEYGNYVILRECNACRG